MGSEMCIRDSAESDTSSSLALQDTWLAQIREKKFFNRGSSVEDSEEGQAPGAQGRVVFYGDDTWLKLFPPSWFARHDGTSSFFVSVSTKLALVMTYVVVQPIAEYRNLFRVRRISQKWTTT